MVADLSEAAPPLPPLAAIPPDLASLRDYEARAPAHLGPALWRHIAEGAGDNVSVRDNCHVYARWRLVPRAFADLRGGSAAVEVPGGRLAAPLLVAPLAYARLAHPEGELAIIRAATAIGLGTVLSTLASATIEAVAAARAQAAAELGTAPAPLWFQLYLQPRREDSLALLRRAEAAGCEAIVLTIDAGVKRAGVTLPPGVDAANLAGMARPRVTAAAGASLFDSALIAAMPTWDDLRWLRNATRLPLWVKGIVAGDDAARLVEAGADGLILSNHGGRVLDGVVTALDLLPAVLDVVGDRMPVMVDGGVRSGGDALKACCLGARAVLVGRPVLHGLAVAGLAGVAHVLHLLRTDFEVGMAQLGCAAVTELTRERLFRL